MRLFSIVLLGLLSLGCSADQTTTEFQVRSETEVVEVDGDADARQLLEPTEAPNPVEAPTEVPVPDAPVTDAPVTDGAGDGLFPTVVAVTASTSDGTSWSVNVTLSSEYDSPERYADAWRVLDADDNELGIRVLGHDHAAEQPFTRSTTVDIPADIAVVYIEGRDQVNGWSGERHELVLER